LYQLTTSCRSVWIPFPTSFKSRTSTEREPLWLEDK
jgi:hypothetical protein